MKPQTGVFFIWLHVVLTFSFYKENKVSFSFTGNKNLKENILHMFAIVDAYFKAVFTTMASGSEQMFDLATSLLLKTETPESKLYIHRIQNINITQMK